MRTELIHSYSTASLSSVFSHAFDEAEDNRNGFAHSSRIKSSSNLEAVRDWSKNNLKKKLLLKKLPVLTWITNYTFGFFVADMIAGLTVGLTLLPQGIAYATIAKVSPQMGLYSAFVGSFVYIFFGTTNHVSIGPTAGLAIGCLSYTTAETRDNYTIILCFLTGIVTCAMGVFQLGFLVNFISLPTLSGFTSAVAITICSTQIKGLLGLRFESDGFLDIITGTISRIQETKLNDSILSLICVILLLFMQRLQQIFPCAAKCSTVLDKVLWFLATARSGIIVIATTVISSLYPSTFVVVGEVKEGLPPLQVPPFYFTTNNGTEEHSVFKLLGSGGASSLVVIPLLALMEHITIAKALAGSRTVDSTQEMLTIGLSNLIGSFFGSMPVTGSFSYSAVNHASGVKSPIGGLATAGLVLLSLQFLTPYFYHLPTAVLASVIICAVIFRIDFGILLSMWNTKKMDFIPWTATFFISLFVGLEYGVICGFLISLTFLLYYAAKPGVAVEKGETSIGSKFIMVHLDRSLVFPCVEYIRYIITKAGSNWAEGKFPVVLDCKHIHYADYTAAQGIKEIFELYNKKEQVLILWNLKPSVVRLVTGGMQASGTPFQCCTKVQELEDLINQATAQTDAKFIM